MLAAEDAQMATLNRAVKDVLEVILELQDQEVTEEVQMHQDRDVQQKVLARIDVTDALGWPRNQVTPVLQDLDSQDARNRKLDIELKFDSHQI